MTIEELYEMITELQERVMENEEQIRGFIQGDVEKIGSLYEAVTVIRRLNPTKRSSYWWVDSIAEHVGKHMSEWGIDRRYTEDALCAAADYAKFEDECKDSVFLGISIKLDCCDEGISRRDFEIRQLRERYGLVGK